MIHERNIYVINFQSDVHRQRSKSAVCLSTVMNKICFLADCEEIISVSVSVSRLLIIRSRKGLNRFTFTVKVNDT